MKAAVVLAAVAVPCLFAEAVDGLFGVDPYRLSDLAFARPSLGHPLGTDELGRDVLSRLAHGGRVTLLVAWFGAVGSVAIGAAVGVLAGWSGGVTERALMRGTEAVMALPKLPLLLLLAAANPGAALGFRPGPVRDGAGLVVLVALLSWPDVARLTRAAVLGLKERGFVQAALGLGLGPVTVLRLHVLPHLAGPLGVAFALEFGGAVLYESALSFLGLGIGAPTPSWGALLARGPALVRDAPLAVVVPGLATVLTVATLHRLGSHPTLRP